MVSGPTQQPVHPTVQTSAPSVVHQPGPSSPRTLPQTTAATTAASVQSTPPTSGVLTALVSTVPTSVQTPQASLPQLGTTVQTLLEMPVGQVNHNSLINHTRDGINLVLLCKTQFISISHTMAILISNLNKPSSVRLILVFLEDIIFPVQIQF